MNETYFDFLSLIFKFITFFSFLDTSYLSLTMSLLALWALDWYILICYLSKDEILILLALRLLFVFDVLLTCPFSFKVNPYAYHVTYGNSMMISSLHQPLIKYFDHSIHFSCVSNVLPHKAVYGHYFRPQILVVSLKEI